MYGCISLYTCASHLSFILTAAQAATAQLVLVVVIFTIWTMALALIVRMLVLCFKPNTGKGSPLEKMKAILILLVGDT